MSQQINLLNPALIKQRDFLNPNNITMTLGLLSALMLGYYGYAQKQLSLLTLQRSQAAEALSATQAQLQQTTFLHTPHEMNKALIEQIAQLEQKETMQQQILQTVNLSSATPEKGYAALMRAFAKQSLDGLWLTSFSFDSSTEKLNINGRTLQADLVPEYISHLGNEPALKGKLFSALSMNLPKIEAAKSPAMQANTGKASSPISTEPEKAVAPKYIEFALQSVEEKSLIGSESAKEEKKS
jgi:Fimbrial assembly protein (PilN)